MSRLGLIAVVVLGCEEHRPREDELRFREAVREMIERPAPDEQRPPTQPPGPTQRLFADDVASDALPLSIGIETLGGVRSVLIPRGTKLPHSLTEMFSTQQDNQSSVEVHVLQGERPLASQNRSLGKFQLHGIPPAPRGVPQIDVTFAIDAAGVLKVSARDRATGKSQDIRIEGGPGGPLDKAAVDRALADAKAEQASDERTSATIQANIDLSNLIWGGRKLLDDVGPKLAAAARQRLERELDRATRALDTPIADGPAKLLAARAALEPLLHRTSEELYKSAARP